MARNRRDVLKTVGGAAFVGTLAGCVGVSEDTETPTEGGDSPASTENDATDGGTPLPPTGTAAAWYALNENEQGRRKETIATFNEKTRHTVEGTDLSDLQKKLNSAVPAGEGPQIFDWAHDLAGDYSQKGFLTPQTGKLDVSLDTFTQAAQGAAKFDGEVIGLPYSAETVGLVYNKELVDSPPKSLSEMKAIMEEHHDPANGSYGLSYPINPYFISGWAQAYGGYYFDHTKDPQLGLSRDSTIKGLRLVLDDLRPYMPNDPKYGAQVAPFLDGNAPFAINGPWFLSSVNKNNLDVGVTGFPSVPDGGSPRPYTGITLWYFAKGMQRDEGKANAAREFAEWFATNESLHLDAAEKFGAIPVLKSLSGSDDLPPKVKGFSQAVEQGYPMPAHPKMNQVWGPMGDGFMKAFNGSADLRTAMEEAEATIRSNWE